MKWIDLIKTALCTIRDKRLLIIVLCMSISSFCLYRGCSLLLIMQGEKSQPFELIVTTQNTTVITESVLAEVAENTDVKETTPVLEIPVRLSVGHYTAELILKGVNSSYLKDVDLPENSVMPYILLNEAALELFVNDSTENILSAQQQIPVNDMPNVDWLGAKTVIFMNDISATSKVLAILTCENEDEPEAYISLNAAKSLLKMSGQMPDYIKAFIRIRNIGCAENVINNLQTFGITAQNKNEQLQTKWDLSSIEIFYLFFVGIICFFFSAFLLYTWHIILSIQLKDTYTLLHQIGMKKNTAVKLFALQAAVISLSGTFLGIIVKLIFS